MVLHERGLVHFNIEPKEIETKEVVGCKFVVGF